MGVTGQLHKRESQQEAKGERSQQSQGMLHAEVESAHPTKAALLQILTASYYSIARHSFSFLKKSTCLIHSFFIYLLICLDLCIYLCVFIYMQRVDVNQYQMFPSVISLPYSLRQDLSLIWSSSFSLDWLINMPHMFYFCLPVLGSETCTILSSFLHGYWNSETRFSCLCKIPFTE